MGWVLTAAGALCLALVFARLGRIMPAEGGPYAYTRAAMGDAPAFLVAWGYWVSVWVGNAAIATAFVAYLTPFFPRLDGSPVLAAAAAVGSIWLLTAVNVWGLREAAVLQLVTTVLKVVPLVAVGTLGLLALEHEQLRAVQRERGFDRLGGDRDRGLDPVGLPRPGVRDDPRRRGAGPGAHDPAGHRARYCGHGGDLPPQRGGGDGGDVVLGAGRELRAVRRGRGPHVGWVGRESWWRPGRPLRGSGC